MSASAAFIAPCFVQPGNIHPAFALAVHAAMHNTATWQSWDVIDNEYASPDETLDAIGRIFVANGIAWTDKERAWWSAELAKNAVRS